MLQKLKSEVKQWIKKDQSLQLEIAKLFEKRNIVTIQRWVDADNLLLTLPGVLNIIRNHKGLSQDAELTEEILEEVQTPATSTR